MRSDREVAEYKEFLSENIADNGGGSREYQTRGLTERISSKSRLCSIL